MFDEKHYLHNILYPTPMVEIADSNNFNHGTDPFFFNWRFNPDQEDAMINNETHVSRKPNYQANDQ